MEINIKPEEIDVYVKQAIIESSIGKIINDSAKKYMQEFMSQSYDSPIRHILNQVVKNLLEEKIKEPDNMKIIMDEFHKQFNEDVIRQIIYNTVNSFSLRFANK